MGPAQDLLGQLWKEYAKSDSRYLIADPFVVSIEAVTVAVWGPLCLSVAYLTAIQHPLKHPLRIIVCVAHLYGDVLYYATSLFHHYVNGISYSRPEALYFWVYYFLMNFVWIVVPAGLLYSSVCTVSNALRAVHGTSEQQKTK
ncbi:EBP domain protein, putative [Talaromyces islandicus]|uniref:EBP domain protein, putative n=1 Tax=Talaromyces islandicus TaxID=28573 RepID=A0A0U1M2U9_TALIS|nr:EBP domain protein, putative [Talaromyces islandicus]